MSNEVERRHRMLAEEAADRACVGYFSEIRATLFERFIVETAKALADIEAQVRSEREERWIPVSEDNLPESDIEVVAVTASGSLAIVYLEFTDDSEGHGKPYWTHGGDDYPFNRFTHYMLPQSPNVAPPSRAKVTMANGKPLDVNRIPKRDWRSWQSLDVQTCYYCGRSIMSGEVFLRDVVSGHLNAHEGCEAVHFRSNRAAATIARQSKGKR